MLQTETRSNSRETPTSYEQGERPPQSTLRDKLLGTSEYQGNVVLLPPGIVAIEAHSDKLQGDTLSQASEIFQKADRERGSFTLGPLQARGFAKLATSEFLLDFHEAAKDQLERHADASNLTLLYDGANTDMDGETKIPSAIIVHEKLSDEALKRLRADLPAGVPLIDGGTNELLDEVGMEERELYRQTTRRQRGMGATALYDAFTLYTDSGAPHDLFDRFSSFFPDQTVVHNSSEYAYEPYDFYAEQSDVWFNPRFFAPEDRKAKDRAEFLYDQTPDTATREDELFAAEADAYTEDARRNTARATAEIRAAAQELYGTNDPTQLTADQLRKVGRRVQGKLHPDRGVTNGGNLGAYKEAGSMIEDLKKHAPLPQEQTNQTSGGENVAESASSEATQTSEDQGPGAEEAYL